MKTLQTQLGSIVAIAMLALPAAASARPLPPGNSAVNQYTESIPTAGGAATAKRHGHGGDRTAAKVLGAAKVRRLEKAGPQGREVAEVVAETAPPSAARPAPAPRASHRPKLGSQAEDPNGSSGFREVIGQATGSSDSGEMGLLLPLLIVAAVAGAAGYVWRQRQRTA
jgi:hypothetical protein